MQVRFLQEAIFLQRFLVIFVSIRIVLVGGRGKGV